MSIEICGSDLVHPPEQVPCQFCTHRRSQHALPGGSYPFEADGHCLATADTPPFEQCACRKYAAGARG